ncbi:MAG: MFS transporter [Alphaproteobacteria bacterium]|nr:MFS transporter [Alphaproteobacteria bacterium]
MATQNLSRDLRLLIVFSALRNITDLFLGTFLVSFIMHLSASEIIAVSTYKLFEYAATCAGFFLLAHWCKRYNKVSVFALNLIPKIALLASIMFLGDRVVDFLIPLGMLYGFGAAMYHLPMNTMVGEKGTPAVMNQFIGTKNTVIYITKVVAPIVLGFFIDMGTYTNVAYVLFFLSLVELGLTFFLTPSRHRSHRPVDFVGFFRCMMRFPVIREMFAMEVLRGFGVGLLGTVITMYTVYMFQTDLNLGIFTTIFAVFSIITSWAFGRWGRRRYYPYILSVAMLLTLVAISIFVYRTTPITFLFYNLVYATAMILMDQICSVGMFNLSRSRCVTANHRVEYFVFRDFALFLGRWIGYVGLMYIGVFGGYAWLRWYLVVITLAILLSSLAAWQLTHHVRGR